MWLFEYIGDMLSMLGLGSLSVLSVIFGIVILLLLLFAGMVLLLFIWAVMAVVWSWTKRAFYAITGKEPPENEPLLWEKWIDRIG